MNIRQERFCQEYIIDHNATEAAKRAGYSPKTAYSIGQRLLKNVEVKERIDKLLSPSMEKAAVTADRVVGELAQIAFADVTKLIKCDEFRYTANEKLRALEMLGKYLSLFTDKTHVMIDKSPNTLKDMSDDELLVKLNEVTKTIKFLKNQDNK